MRWIFVFCWCVSVSSFFRADVGLNVQTTRRRLQARKNRQWEAEQEMDSDVEVQKQQPEPISFFPADATPKKLSKREKKFQLGQQKQQDLDEFDLRMSNKFSDQPSSSSSLQPTIISPLDKSLSVSVSALSETSAPLASNTIASTVSTSTSTPLLATRKQRPPSRVRFAESSQPDYAMIALEGVGVSFGDVDVLREVSFAVATGERVGLVGPNGAGKVTE